MNHAVVIVWLGTAAARTSHEPVVTSWAESRQVAIEDPAADAPLADAHHDDAAAARIESLASEAEAALFTDADPDAARGALDDAEALVRSRPDLPEAAWLLAGVLRTRADLVGRTDPDARANLLRRAVVLEGTRAPAFVATTRPSSAPRGAPASPPGESTIASSVASSDGASIALVGPLAADDVYVDGVPVNAARTVTLGEHHVRVLRDGRLAFAGFVTATTGAVRIAVPGVVPCSNADLASVTLSDGRLSTGGAVTCPSWAVARPTTADGIEFATCHGSVCGTWLPWRRDWGAAFEGPVHPTWHRAPSHAWILWTAAGALALVATSVALVASGAFEREPAPQRGFTFSSDPRP
ncbi:MAG TPA: hypothetical protein VH142_00870 [Polyangiaceae bacterium]|jgi:hypothetical protein|nr:hypothetical protein [Polyangiaceae bacterium]